MIYDFRRTTNVAAGERHGRVGVIGHVHGGAEVDQGGVVGVPDDVVKADVMVDDMDVVQPLQRVKDIDHDFPPVCFSIRNVDWVCAGKDPEFSEDVSVKQDPQEKG